MKYGPDRPSHDILSDVRSQFERWRRRRPRGTRIPAALWQAAVEAAEEHGVSKTSQELSLDYYGLKERVESAVEERSPVEGDGGRGFLEIPVFAAAASGECVLEIEDGQGARLRVEHKGAAAAELEPLAHALWSVGR